MDSFAGGSKSLPQDDHPSFTPGCRPRPLEPLDRPGKRRRSVSPMNDKLSRHNKRPSYLQPHLQAALPKIRKEEYWATQSPQPSPTITAAVDSMNERTTRLGLENAYPEDVEVWNGLLSAFRRRRRGGGCHQLRAGTHASSNAQPCLVNPTAA